jgi:hypothetical protein
VCSPTIRPIRQICTLYVYDRQEEEESKHQPKLCVDGISYASMYIIIYRLRHGRNVLNAH